jgi:hypothetical protein
VPRACVCTWSSESLVHVSNICCSWRCRGTFESPCRTKGYLSISIDTELLYVTILGINTLSFSLKTEAKASSERSYTFLIQLQLKENSLIERELVG